MRTESIAMCQQRNTGAVFFTALLLCCLMAFLSVVSASNNNKKTVLILGGGIGGLTAALELADRDGYRVFVVEKTDRYGGKARSIRAPGTGTQGREDWPGEHGFRFFPGFYMHIDDTMRRIPYGAGCSGNGKAAGTVLDNLIRSDAELFCSENTDPITIPVHVPTDGKEWIKDVLDVLRVTKLGIPVAEAAYFVQRLLVAASMCPARWDEQMDQFSYWNFTRASELSEVTRKYLVIGATRNLLACKAELASLKTIGRTGIRMIESSIKSSLDRVLNGPTNEQWIFPWVDHLRSRGVEFVPATAVLRFNLVPGASSISSVTVQDTNTGRIYDMTADHYVAAVPIEKMVDVVQRSGDALVKAAPSLAQLTQHRTDWMSGLQYYFKKDISLVKGHVNFFDSPWALTSVSQQQFWRLGKHTFNVSQMGDGSAVDVLSVDLSNWYAPGYKDGPSRGLPAINCTAEQIILEVYHQMQRHLPKILPPWQKMSQVVSAWFIDPDIRFDGPNGTRGVSDNEEPLMVNLVGKWKYRPNAITEIKNLFIGSEYAKTNTDLACMEGANEAARRAVNGILQADGRSDLVKIYELPWPTSFKLEQELDCWRMKHGHMPIGWDFPVPKHAKRDMAKELESHLTLVASEK